MIILLFIKINVNSGSSDGEISPTKLGIDAAGNMRYYYSVSEQLSY